MPNYTTTPNMSLPVPIVGTETGPQYAFDLNSCMTLIDTHDHTAGNGVPITQEAFNLTADLTFSSFNATSLRSVRFTAQNAPLSVGTDLGCLYEVTNDLYYNDGLGNQIRLTQSGAVAGTSGSISNLVAPATASYNSSSKTFIWQQNTNQAANMDMAAAILRPTAASASGVTIAPPIGLASSYSLTLLSALPAATRMLTIDNTGNLGTWNIDNSTITVAASVLSIPIDAATIVVAGGQVKVGTVQLANMAANSVVTTQLVDASVTAAKRAALTSVVSSDCGLFTTSSTSAVQVTNFSVNLTVTGTRPVWVGLISANTGAGSQGAVIGTSNGSTQFLTFSDNFGSIANLDAGSAVSTTSRHPSSAFSQIYTPAHGAGTYTFTCKVQCAAGGGGSITVQYSKLMVYEL